MTDNQSLEIIASSVVVTSSFGFLYVLANVHSYVDRKRMLIELETKYNDKERILTNLTWLEEITQFIVGEKYIYGVGDWLARRRFKAGKFDNKIEELRLWYGNQQSSGKSTEANGY